MPPEYQITCIHLDERGIIDESGMITHVGLDNGSDLYTISQIVRWMQDGTHHFYTFRANNRVEVFAKRHPISSRWFLTTDPAGVLEKNLDFLPQC